MKRKENDEVHQMRNEMKNLRKKRFILMASGRRIVLLWKKHFPKILVYCLLKFKDDFLPF